MNTISDASFSEINRMLEYKSKYKGNTIYKVDRFYPSSKTCSKCGSIKENLKLKERIYKCDKCNYTIDRDLNASLNLENSYIKQIGKVLPELTPVDLTALLKDLEINKIATSKVESGIQQNTTVL